MELVLLIVMALGLGFALPEVFRGKKMKAARFNAGAIVFAVSWILYVLTVSI